MYSILMVGGQEDKRAIKGVHKSVAQFIRLAFHIPHTKYTTNAPICLVIKTIVMRCSMRYLALTPVTPLSHTITTFTLLNTRSRR